MAFNKKKLLDGLLRFKKAVGRLPCKQDFETKAITPSYRTYLRAFESLENMEKQLDLYERGELVFKDERRVELTPNKATKRKSNFSCPFCGSNIQKPFDYCTCKDLIIWRLVDLIKSHSTDTEYCHAVFDCLAKTFGAAHQEVENALRREGFFAAYQMRVWDDEDSLKTTQCMDY